CSARRLRNLYCEVVRILGIGFCRADYLLHEPLGMPAIGALVAYGFSPRVSFLVAGSVLFFVCWLCVKYYEPMARRFLSEKFFKKSEVGQSN
ncbi:hypothetical protein ACFIQG_17435, partial [Comamonas odontotermitis]|uniref:hypothetical protein n=1 Tax=Comamonas odontotermitis TaxID=379895 RepID=UPI0036718E2C